MKITPLFGRIFDINNDGEYATIALIQHSNVSVTVMAHSSFGDFSHTWTNTGKPPIEFLKGLNFNYAMGKFKGNDGKVADIDAFKSQVKHYIQLEVENDAYAERIQELNEELDEVLEAGNSIETLSLLVYQSEALSSLLNEYGCDGIPSKYSQDCVSFWEQIWQPFIAELAVTSLEKS